MKQPFRQEHEGKIMKQRLLDILKRAGRPLNYRGWVAVLLAINTLVLPLSAQNILQRLDHDLTAFYHRGDIDTAFVMRPETKWTLKAMLNVSGAKLESEGVEEGAHFKANMTADYKTTLSLGVSYLGVSVSMALNPAKLMGKYHDYELTFTSYGRRFG